MSRIVSRPQLTIWEQICQEYEDQRQLAEKGECYTDDSDTADFDPKKHHPVFHGQVYHPIESDYHVRHELNASIGHPACAGLWLEADQSSRQEDEARASYYKRGPAPDRKTCSNAEFLEYYVWPCVLPALEATLLQARQEGCIKPIMRVPFNSVDFLMRTIFNSNPMHAERKDAPVQFDDIPFVKAFLEIHPRPPIPAHSLWSADETATKMQAFYRGYQVRREPEVQELRRWQREWRVLNLEKHIFEEVAAFWDLKMPLGTGFGSNASSGSSLFGSRTRQRHHSYTRRSEANTRQSKELVPGSHEWKKRQLMQQIGGDEDENEVYRDQSSGEVREVANP